MLRVTLCSFIIFKLVYDFINLGDWILFSKYLDSITIIVWIWWCLWNGLCRNYYIIFIYKKDIWVKNGIFGFWSNWTSFDVLKIFVKCKWSEWQVLRNQIFRPIWCDKCIVYNFVSYLKYFMWILRLMKGLISIDRLRRFKPCNWKC